MLADGVMGIVGILVASDGGDIAGRLPNDDGNESAGMLVRSPIEGCEVAGNGSDAGLETAVGVIAGALSSGGEALMVG